MSLVNLHTHVFSTSVSVYITIGCGFHAKIHLNSDPKLSDVESTLEKSIKVWGRHCWPLFFLFLSTTVFPFSQLSRHQSSVIILLTNTHTHTHTGDLGGPSQLVQSPICSNSCCYCCCLAPWLIWRVDPWQCPGPLPSPAWCPFVRVCVRICVYISEFIRRGDTVQRYDLVSIAHCMCVCVFVWMCVFV